MANVREVLIVGGGLAGAKTAEALRDEGFDGSIALICAERHAPYERPPLSKGYLQGKEERETVFVHPEQWYRDNGIDLHLQERVVQIDRSAATVAIESHGSMPYDALVLATGSTPRRLEVPGADLDGVITLRTLDDSDALRATLEAVNRIAIIGGGWIGLEAAAAAREAGVDVTLLEAGHLPLERVLGPDVAQVFADLHRDHGVDLRTDVTVEQLIGDQGRVIGVRLASGEEIAAEAVLVGVGISPNIELASEAELEVENGIVVDEHLRTSDPSIYAVGDVANAWHPTLNRRIRVEHWANARYQPAVAAAGIVGRDARYDRQPYFFSDQYDLGMEYYGYSEPGSYDDVIIRGDLGARRFLAFWIVEDRVIAAMHANMWDDAEDLLPLISSTKSIDAELLADPDVSLEQVA